MGASVSRRSCQPEALDRAQRAVEAELQKDNVNEQLLAELVKARDWHAEILKKPTWEVKIWLVRPAESANASESAPQARSVAPAAAPADPKIWHVLRLEDDGSTVGTACLLDRALLLTCRHCLDPQPGERIRVDSLSVLGHPVSHVASFPAYDVTVLRLAGGKDSWPKLLQDAPPFELGGGVGIQQGTPIALIGYPLVMDNSVRGFRQSSVPLLAQGKVGWLTDTAEEAVGTYAGAFPNSSGGAVALGAPYHYLAGLHVGAIWHEAGRRQHDTMEDQDQGAAGGVGGGAAAAGVVVVETDTWSDAAVGGLAARAVCGSGKQQVHKGSASSFKPVTRAAAAQQQSKDGAAARDEKLQQCVEDVAYCVANVEHKGSMGVFVPAATLSRLLGLCPYA